VALFIGSPVFFGKAALADFVGMTEGAVIGLIVDDMVDGGGFLNSPFHVNMFENDKKRDVFGLLVSDKAL
jgi:hypothetical protein